MKREKRESRGVEHKKRKTRRPCRVENRERERQRGRERERSKGAKCREKGRKETRSGNRFMH